MIDLEKKIAQRQERIRDLRSQIALAHRAIGESIVESPPEDLNAGLSQTRTQILDVQATASGYSSLIERIHEITARRAAIQEEKNAIQGEIRETEKDNENFFESIGEAAYEATSSAPSGTSDYQDLFEELRTSRHDIEAVRTQVREAEEELENKRFFDKVVVRGRLALLRGKLANKEGSLPRLFFRLGQRIVESDFAQNVNSTDLDQALEPYNQNQSRTAKLNTQLQNLQTESSGLETELEEAGAGRKPGRRISELEQLTQDCERQKQALLEELGASSLQSVPDTKLSAAAVEAQGNIANYEAQIETENAHIARLQAAIEAMRLTEEIGHVERDVSDKNETMKELKASIAELKKRKTELESMRDAALERRGPEDDL